MLLKLTRIFSAWILIVCTSYANANPIFAQNVPTFSHDVPDKILINGHVLTVDSQDSEAQAIAIKGSRIILVGSSVDIMKHADASTKVIDLRGRTVTPGLIDTHNHFSAAGVQNLYNLSLDDAIRIDDVLKKVYEKAITLSPGEWIQGNGWDNGKLAELRDIYASDLDRVSPNNPVWLTHSTGHYGVANSYALNLANISGNTSNPPGGIIDRDEKGIPTGLLREQAAMKIITNQIPPVTEGQLRKAILNMIEGFHAEGMTALKDPGIDDLTWNVYRQLLDEGKLTVRVFPLWLGGNTIESAQQLISQMPKTLKSLGDDRLLTGGVKLYIDGSGGARTAWLYDDWNKTNIDIDVGNKGSPETDPIVYRQMVHLFHQAGMHVATHSIGDRGIDWVVDTYAQVQKENPRWGMRHAVIHSNIPSDDAIKAMAKMQMQHDTAYPESQPGFAWWIGDSYAGNFGPKRSIRFNPFNTYLSKGIIWTSGSDFNVTPFPARYGIWSSVARETLNGVYGKTPFGTTEAVSVQVALRSYTAWAARQLFLEEQIGSIAAGKRADLAIWDRNPYTVPTADLKGMRCEMTLFDGQIVHKTEAFVLE